jgi:hypothetical protein
VTEVSGGFRERKVPNELGHEFTVTLRFRHTQAPNHPYDEMPRLVWSEKILFKDYKTMKFWEWGEDGVGSDLYGYSPDAGTFKAWRQRYLLAYQNANHESPDCYFGDSRLTVNGGPVTTQMIQAAAAQPATEMLGWAANRVVQTRGGAASRFHLPSLGQRRDRIAPTVGTTVGTAAITATIVGAAPAVATEAINSAEKKAKAVRSFIHQHDCELTVTIIDRPSIAVSNRHAERLLLFNCGVAGRTIRANQRLQTNPPEGTPRAHFALGWQELTLPLDGFSADMNKGIYNLQYEARLLADPPDLVSHALSLEIDGHLGNGEYR